MTIDRQTLLQQKQVSISCIVPVYNEKEVISDFIQQLTQQLKQLSHHFEIIVVDDGSQDGTYQELTQLASHATCKFIRFSRNFGKETALTAGLEYATGDVVILIDADFQHPIALIPEFLKQWSEGHDMVYGVRNNRDDESPLKRNFAQGFYKLLSKITQLKIPNNAGDFRLLDRKVVSALNKIPERGRFMKGLYAWVGFNSIGIPFDVQSRAAGNTSYKFTRLAELAITGITSFSDMPLRVWGYIGFVISTFSLIYAVYFLIKTLIFGADVPGFPSILVGVMFFGGIQLLSIGILGEYIARIFNEVKQRPQYIIEEKMGFKE